MEEQNQKNKKTVQLNLIAIEKQKSKISELTKVSQDLVNNYKASQSQFERLLAQTISEGKKKDSLILQTTNIQRRITGKLYFYRESQRQLDSMIVDVKKIMALEKRNSPSMKAIEILHRRILSLSDRIFDPSFDKTFE